MGGGAGAVGQGPLAGLEVSTCCSIACAGQPSGVVPSALCCCRSFEDVERMAQPGGELARDGKHALTIPQRFSLAHRADLLKPNSARCCALHGLCAGCGCPCLRPAAGWAQHATACSLQSACCPPCPCSCSRGRGGRDAGGGAGGAGGGQRLRWPVAHRSSGRLAPLDRLPRRRWGGGAWAAAARKRLRCLPSDPGCPATCLLLTWPAPAAADFLATQPTKPTEGVILQLAEKLVADGRLFPPALAMCQCAGLPGC